MPYIIAFVIIVVAAAALLFFREPAGEEPIAPPVTEEQVSEEVAPMDDIDSEEAEPGQADSSLNDDTETAPSDVIPEAEADLEVGLSEPAVEVAPEPVATVATYQAEASYLTPRRTNHDIDVTLTLEGTTVTAANILYDGGAPGTPAHSGFDQAYKSEVIGKDISEVKLSRTGGASLTSDAFNEAVADIRAQI